MRRAGLTLSVRQLNCREFYSLRGYSDVMSQESVYEAFQHYCSSRSLHFLGCEQYQPVGDGESMSQISSDITTADRQGREG